MSAASLGPGKAVALRRSLTGSHDPLALYAALTERGARRNTSLIETDGRSFIIERAALVAECSGQRVVLNAMSEGGVDVLREVASKLRPYVEEDEQERLTLAYPRCDAQDAEARLLASSPFDALRILVQKLESLSPEEANTLFLGGILAFDHVDIFEDLPRNEADPASFPDFYFCLAESLVVVEPGGHARLVVTAFGSDDPQRNARAFHGAAERLADLFARCTAANASGASGSPTPLTPPLPREPIALQQAICSDPCCRAPDCDLDDAAFASLVERLKEHITAGDAYQVVPSRTFSGACPDPLGAFARQRRLDPSPYMFYVAAPRHILFGASPEAAVSVRREGWPIVRVQPIAGTRPRGATTDEDDRLEADLRLDVKEVAEHMMLVDLARNDVARISIAGTRRVESLLAVKHYARVMHLVSYVCGHLAIGFDVFHALQSCLNVGTLSGAPKLKAIELLRRYERTKRGPYGGAVGWMSGAGEMDTGVVIRSALVMDGIAYVRAGAGVVEASDPMREADETRAKASALLAAIRSEAAA